MTGKELILSAFEHKKTERTPWIPYTGVQIGSLKNYTATEVLQDRNKLLSSLIEANNLYSPDGMPVIFDLQVEAEILGCELLWDAKAPPTVKTHPLAENKKINLKIPQKTDGRIPLILDVMNKLKEEIGEKTALYGLICGPLTLASHLRSTNIFMDMYDDINFVNDLISFVQEVNLSMASYYIGAGMDVIAVVDPMVSLISPDTFKQFLDIPYKKIFKYIRSENRLSSFFVCGDATKNISLMAETNPDGISIDENVDIIEAKKITDKHNIVISGNIPLSSVMLLGTQQDNQKYAIDLIEKIGDVNFILAPGCDMPYDVPKENIIGIAQAVQDTAAVKKVLETYKKEQSHINVNLPDYKNLKKPLIEVFTIDSSTCAACGYMKKIADKMKELFGDKIDVIERKSTEPENFYRLEQLGIKNLPTLLINGELKFISMIPDYNTFKKEIEQVL